MAKPASIPFFGDAYLADTTHLTTEEHGAYFLLLLAAWRQEDCALPNDDRKLARIVGLSTKKWSSVKQTIMEFWTVEDGRIYQLRLRREWNFVRQKSQGNRKSAEARWNKQGTEKQGSDPMRSHSDRNAPPPPKKEEDTVDKSTAADAAKSDPADLIRNLTPSDITKAVFDTGRTVLAEIVRDDGRARSIIGKWRKLHGDAAVLVVLSRYQAQAPPPSQPIEWITGALQAEARRASGQSNGQSPQSSRPSIVDLGQSVAEQLQLAQQGGPR